MLEEMLLRDLVKERPVHLIGAGSLMSHAAQLLFPHEPHEVHLWDSDTVEEKNLKNQRFEAVDIGSFKVDAVYRIAKAVNPTLRTEIVAHREMVHPETRLTGIVLAGVDSYLARKRIFSALTNSPDDDLFYIDGRTGLRAGKVFALYPSNIGHAARYLLPENLPSDVVQVPQQDGPCWAPSPGLSIVTRVAADMMARLELWLMSEKGSDTPFANLSAFAYAKEGYGEHIECWDV